MTTLSKYLLRFLVCILIIWLAVESEVTLSLLKDPAIIISLFLWIIALVALLIRRDIDIHDKLSWVVTILLLNGIGAILYFVFGPKRKYSERDKPEVNENAVPINPEKSSWNPVLGQNRMSKGVGLNPKETDQETEQGHQNDLT